MASLYEGRKLDLLTAVASFYVLQDLITLPKPEFHPILNRYRPTFEEDLKSFTNFFSEKLAKTLFDYLALVSFGEARHAKNSCSAYIYGFPSNYERDQQYSLATKYDPFQFLPIISNLFSNYKWLAGSFGGHSWGRIAHLASTYKEKTPVEFIDHVVDVSHNGGLAFDKSILIKMPNVAFYERLLNDKFEYSLIKDNCTYNNYARYTIDYFVWDFYNKSRRLKYHDSHSFLFNISETGISFPKPIKWGKKKISESIWFNENKVATSSILGLETIAMIVRRKDTTKNKMKEYIRVLSMYEKGRQLLNSMNIEPVNLKTSIKNHLDYETEINQAMEFYDDVVNPPYAINESDYSLPPEEQEAEKLTIEEIVKPKGNSSVKIDLSDMDKSIASGAIHKKKQPKKKKATKKKTKKYPYTKGIAKFNKSNRKEK